MTKNPLGRFLLDELIKYDQKTGIRNTWQDFADYLGVSRESLAQWREGKYIPSREACDIMAPKLGPRIYDLSGYARPPEYVLHVLQEIQDLYDAASPDDQPRLYKEITEKLASIGLKIASLGNDKGG